MARRLSAQELKEDLDYILHMSWDIDPDSLFYHELRSNRDIKKDLVGALILCSIWGTDDDIKKRFSAYDSEARKVRTLMCYFYYLQHKRIEFTRVSEFDKEDYNTFRTNPKLWSVMNNKFTGIMCYYLNNPIIEPETHSSRTLKGKTTFAY